MQERLHLSHRTLAAVQERSRAVVQASIVRVCQPQQQQARTPHLDSPHAQASNTPAHGQYASQHQHHQQQSGNFLQGTNVPGSHQVLTEALTDPTTAELRRAVNAR